MCANYTLERTAHRETTTELIVVGDKRVSLRCSSHLQSKSEERTTQRAGGRCFETDVGWMACRRVCARFKSRLPLPTRFKPRIDDNYELLEGGAVSICLGARNERLDFLRFRPGPGRCGMVPVSTGLATGALRTLEHSPWVFARAMLSAWL